MIILVYILVIFVCVFILYILSKSDFVLLRQNISLSEIFDALFITFISAYLVGRTFDMINRLESNLLSILLFFHIFKYPGISLLGLFLGGGVSLYLIFMKKKGAGRISDIFAISFFPLFAVNLFFEKYSPALFFLPYILFFFSIVFFIFLTSSHNKYTLRDGSISLIFVLLLAFTTFIFEYFSKSPPMILSLSFLQIVSLVATPSALFALVVNQRKKNS